MIYVSLERQSPYSS